MQTALTVWVASDGERIAHIYSYDGSAFMVALEQVHPPLLKWMVNAATLAAATSVADVWFGSEREPVSWSMYKTDPCLSLVPSPVVRLFGTGERLPPTRYGVHGLAAGRSAAILREGHYWRVEMIPAVDLPAHKVPPFERPEQALLFIEALQRLSSARPSASTSSTSNAPAPWRSS